MTFYPTTTSSFLEIHGSMCLAIAAKLSPLFLKDLWVKTLMHRTLGTILVMSWNKAKHLSSFHYFTKARKYNTQTNSLPLFHTGEEDPFSLLHTSERVITRSLGTENLTQHLIPPWFFNKRITLLTYNTRKLKIVNQIHTITFCMVNKIP